jgi:hypothetical protein
MVPEGWLLVKSGVAVEKVRDRNVFSATMMAAAEFFVPTLS